MGWAVFNQSTGIMNGDWLRWTQPAYDSETHVLIETAEAPDPKTSRLNETQDGIVPATTAEETAFETAKKNALWDDEVDDPRIKALSQAFYAEIKLMAAQIPGYSAPTTYAKWRTKVRNKRKAL